MEVFLLIVTIIACAIFVIVNIYITAIYKHKQQSIINPKNIFCLVLIMITLIQIQFQPLFMIVDVINSRSSDTNLTLFWVILYFSILVNLAFIKPLAASIYQSDEDDPLWKRILWIIAEVIISTAVFGMFLGIGWLFFGYLDLNFTSLKINSFDYQINNITQPIPQNYFQGQSSLTSSIQTRLTIPCFLLGLLCLFGYPLLICCGSCGLTALPLSLIMQFNNRPQFRRTNEAKKIVQSMKQQTVLLIKESQNLKRAMTRIQFVDGWWSRRTKKSQLQNSLKQIQARFDFHRQYYELFHLQLKMQDVNPLVYIGKLVLGIVCIFISIILWLQILLSQLIFTVGKRSGSVFLDTMFIYLEKQNANFVSIAIIMLICVYFSISTIKGTMFFSNNVPFITVHPMIEGKTWLNSFLFQLTLCVLSGASLVHLMLGTFPYYLRGGQISLMMGQILEGMHFVQIFIKNKVFIYGYLIMGIGGGIFVLVKSICFTQGKTQLLKEIQQKRKRLFGKDNIDKPLHMIEMTQMHLQDKQNQIKQVKQRKKNRQKQNKKKQSLWLFDLLTFFPFFDFFYLLYVSQYLMYLQQQTQNFLFIIRINQIIIIQIIISDKLFILYNRLFSGFQIMMKNYPHLYTPVNKKASFSNQLKTHKKTPSNIVNSNEYSKIPSSKTINHMNNPLTRRGNNHPRINSRSIQQMYLDRSSEDKYDMMERKKVLLEQHRKMNQQYDNSPTFGEFGTNSFSGAKYNQYSNNQSNFQVDRYSIQSSEQSQLFQRSYQKIGQIKYHVHNKNIDNQLNQVLQLIKQQKLRANETVKTLKKAADHYKKIYDNVTKSFAQNGVNTEEQIAYFKQIQSRQTGIQCDFTYAENITIRQTSPTFSKVSNSIHHNSASSTKRLDSPGRREQGIDGRQMQIYLKLATMLQDMNIDSKQILPQDIELNFEVKDYKNLSEGEIIKIQKFFIKKLVQKIPK